MNFVHPYLLFFEALVLLLAGVYLLSFRARRRALAAFADAGLVNRLSSAAPAWQMARAVCALAAVFFIILALARPQYGAKVSETTQRAADIVIAIDVSESMLSEDIKPNRMARAKELLGALISQLEGNRIGVIAFAGVAFWQCPLTLDTAGAKMFLDLVDTSLIPSGGTAIGDALRLGTKALASSPARTKAIILLTDGEDHRSAPEEAARAAARHSIRIFAVGFGSAAGEPIPLRDEQGAFTGYKKDKKGTVVMSKLDEKLLASLASETDGLYMQAQDGAVDIARLGDAVSGLDKAKVSSRLSRSYEDRYQYPLAAGLVFLLGALFLPRRKRGAA